METGDLEKNAGNVRIYTPDPRPSDITAHPGFAHVMDRLHHMRRLDWSSPTTLWIANGGTGYRRVRQRHPNDPRLCSTRPKMIHRKDEAKAKAESL